MDFYQRLNYSLGNEDWHVEEQALGISAGDRVICVTASGDRPLHLLMTECSEIMSLDMNSIQSYLLNLKLAALSILDFEKYLAFLGGTSTPHRLTIFKQIKPFLTPDSLAFWEQHPQMIASGIIYQGRLERLTSIASKFFKLCRLQKIKQLLSFNHIEEQREFITNKWDSWFCRHFFAMMINPKFSTLFFKDPGFNSFTDYTTRPGEYVYQRMLRYLNNNLAKKSPLLQLVFNGKLLPDAYFPYLTFAGYNKIRENIGRLHYRTDNIIEFLERTDKKFDSFSLSDIASYMPQAVFEKLLRAISHAANPNAHFCIRQFMSNRIISPDLQNQFVRNPTLEQKLEREETNFVYRFMVGEVKKITYDNDICTDK